MKLRLTVLGTVLSLLFAVASAEALILDAPHNRDNGIYCYHCHSADPATGEHRWFAADDDPVFDPADSTRYNWVCNRCHTPLGTRTIDIVNPDDSKFAGPVKKLHASSSTDTSLGTWSTECIDCHDPHFQAQIEWADTDLDAIYVGLGTVNTTVAAIFYDENDTAFGHTGATILGVTLSKEDIPAAEWARKGKAAGFENRGEDNSRGLILIVDKTKPNSSRTFEIVDMEVSGADWKMKVKGDITFGTTVVNNQEFGVLYGGLLKQQVTTPAGEVRDVKFFTPNKVLAAPGGPVDLTLGETAPVGLCQVCHQSTVYFVADTEEANHHDADGKECHECHDVLEGGAPETPHTSFITATIGCANCHTGYDTAPDTAHIDAMVDVGCQTCHTAQAPYLNASVELRVPYSSDGNIHGSVTCLQCHNITYGGVDYGDGASHPTTAQNDDKDLAHTDALVVQDFCVSVCHGTLGVASTGIDIVENTDTPAGGHSNNCGFCHLTVTPPVELTAGAAAAASPATASQCNVCHDTYFTAHDHGVMDTIDNGTAEHVITNHVDCSGCHNSTDTAAPDAINAPYVGTDEVHYNLGSGCALCHSATNGAPTGSATNWNAGVWGPVSADTNNNCVSCHGAFFDSHSHTHDVSFSSSVDKTTGGTGCYTCHDDAALGKGTLALGTWASILTEHETVNKIAVNGCSTCHSYIENQSGDADTPLVATVSSVIANNSSVKCGTCHTKKVSESHGSHLSTEFGWTPATETSCGGGGVVGACHDYTVNDDVVLEVHGHISVYDDAGAPEKPCNLCHSNVVTNTYTRISGTDADATQATDRTAACTVCHTGTIPFMHHENNSTYITYTPTTDCATQCHNSAKGGAADHIAGSAPGMVLDRTDTGEELGCSVCHTAYNPTNIILPADGNNTPVDPTVSPTGDRVHDACTTCHEIEAVTNIVKLVGITAIATAMPDGGTPNGGTDGGGTCTACHTGYFEAHTHHDSAKNNFKYNFTLGQETSESFPYADPVVPTLGSDFYLDMSWDINRAVTPGPVGCGQPGVTPCHTDLILDDPASLTTWEGIKLEHDRIGTPASNVAKDGQQGCYTCHYNDSRDNGINNAKFAALDTVGDVVAKGTKNAGLVDFVNCTDCHFDKKADNVHGLMTVNHLRTNTTFQGTLGYPPIIADPECSTECHMFSDIDDGTAATTDPLDIVIGIHKNSCGMCHVSQPNLLNTAGKDFDNLAQSITSFYCTDCHSDVFTGLTKLYHGVEPTHAQVQSRHNRMNDPSYSDSSQGSPAMDCMTCHGVAGDMTMVMDGVLLRHMPNYVDIATTPEECLVCHAPVVHNAGVVPNDSTAVDVITAGRTGTGGGDAAQTCEDCHTGKGVYSMHGMLADITGEGVANEHNNLDALSGNVGDLDCANCHTMGNNTEKLTVHVTNGCTGCHTAGTPASDQITDGLTIAQGGTNTSQTCVVCHTGISVHMMHGMTNGEMDGASGHNMLADSTGTDDTDCGQCHADTTQTLRAALHPGCFTNSCHDSGQGTPATTSITNGMAGSTINCETCHYTPTKYYTMHEMTEANVAAAHNQVTATSGFAGNDECSLCHTMGTDLQRLQLHVTNGCTGCHTSGDGKVITAISDGTSVLAGGSNTPQTCKSCHDVQGDSLLHGLTDATVTGAQSTGTHEKLVTNGVLDADCKACHTPDTEVGRLTIHPANPNNCRACHESTDTATIAAITAGVGGTSVSCEDCHNGADQLANIAAATTGFFNHDINTDHTVANSNTAMQVLKDNVDSSTAVVHCVGCHNEANQVLIHDSVAPAASPNVCAECHHTDGELLSAANGNPTSASDNYTASSTAECIDCHGAGSPYFDNHVTRDTSHSTIENTAVLASGGDRAQASGQLCSDCHYDSSGAGTPGSGESLDTWAEILVEHQTVAGTGGQNACEVCHLSTRTNGTHPGSIDVAVGTSVAEVIAAGGTRQCLDCHFGKKAPAGHGGHDSTQFVWQTASETSCGGSGGNLTCHDSGSVTDVVNVIHDAAYATAHGNYCLNCHSTVSGGDATYLNTAPNGRAGGLSSQNTTAPPHNPVECTACHTGGATFFDGHVSAGYSHAGEVLTPSDTTTFTKDCMSCHDGATSPYVGGANNHTGCDSCHSTSNGALVDANGSTGTAGVGGSAECIDCHTTWFDGHLTKNELAGNHDISMGSDQSSGQACNDTGCHGVGGTSNANKFVDTWEGINGVWQLHDNVGTNGCIICHDSNKTTGMSGYANMQAAIKSGTDTLTCLNCHNDRAAGHGGHDATHFPWTTANGIVNQSTCGNNALGAENGVNYTCHATNEPLIGDGTADSGLHLWGPIGDYWDANGGRCKICHATNSGGDNNIRLHSGGDLADADGGTGSGATHDLLCTACHMPGAPVNFDKPGQHHNSTRAKSGFCSDCHGDPREAEGFPIITQKACRGCHITVTGTPPDSIVTVQAIKLGLEGDNGTGLIDGNTFTDIIKGANRPAPKTGQYTAGHQWTGSNATGINETAIDNYGACLFCHGLEGNVMYPAAVKVVPYHALPLPGAWDAGNNTIGGDGYRGSTLATPMVDPSWGRAQFRGNQAWTAAASNSYWPIGKGRMNIGYAQHSVAKGATNYGAIGKGTNSGALATYKSLDTTYGTINYGKQIVNHLAPEGTVQRYVPHFDTPAEYATNNTTQNAGAGLDTISGVAVTQEDAITGGGPGYAFTATSSAGAGTVLHVIWGGVDLGSFTSGNALEISVDPSAAKWSKEVVDAELCLDQFGTENDTPFMIVSELGGSYVETTNLVTNRGIGTSEIVGSTCNYLYSP